MPHDIAHLTEQLRAAEAASAAAAAEQDQAETALASATSLYLAQSTEANGAALLAARNALDLAGVRLASAQSTEDTARAEHDAARTELDDAERSAVRARILAELDALRANIGRAAFVRDALPLAAQIAALESDLHATIQRFGEVVIGQIETHARAVPLAVQLGEDIAPPIGEDAAERLARTLVYQAITTVRPIARRPKDWPYQGATSAPWRGGSRAVAFWIDAPADIEGAYRFGLVAHTGVRADQGADASLWGSVTWIGNTDDYMPGVPVIDKLDALIAQGTIAPLRNEAERLTTRAMVRDCGQIEGVFARSARAAKVAKRLHLTVRERVQVQAWITEGEAARLARSIAWERAKTLGYGSPDDTGAPRQIGAIPQDVDARRAAPRLLAWWAWYHESIGQPTPDAAEMSSFISAHRASDLPKEHRGTSILARIEAETAERRRAVERRAALSS